MVHMVAVATNVHLLGIVLKENVPVNFHWTNFCGKKFCNCATLSTYIEQSNHRWCDVII